MKINDDYVCQGAALTQIAEQFQFTAINVFMTAGAISRSVFDLNAAIGVCFEYASKPKAPFSE